MRHIYHCPLRWADLDVLGHVNNVRYVDYLQEARVDMLSLHGSSSAGQEMSEGVVVVQHDITFVRPLLLRPEPVRIETWVSRVRAASFTMAYEIVDDPGGGDRVVYARATTILTPFLFDEQRPRRITPDERTMLSRFLVEEDVRRG